MDLKSKLLFPISPDIITRMSQPILKMTGRDIPWICNFLFANFGLLTPREMEELTKSLDVYFLPEAMTLSAHCAKHIAAHNLALTNNEPFREHQKVTLFKRSLLPCNLYTTALEAWAREFPTIAQQTFENLQNAMQRADDYRETHSTVANLGYGTAAAALQSSSAVPVVDADYIAQLVAAAVTAQLKPTAPAPAAPTRPKVRLYCFTHGLCAHTSQQCTKPSDNHQTRATAKNTMGGADPTKRASRF